MNFDRLFALKELYEKDIITEKDFTDEELEYLIKLYEIEIEEKEKEIKELDND